MIGGMQLYVNQYLCNPEFVRWKKSHRKSRINKKWHKKYGAIFACKGVAFQMIGNRLLICPCMYEMIKREIRLANHDEMLTAPVPHSLMFSVF